MDYLYRKAGSGDLWIEVYRDDKYEYKALFGSASTSHIPMTILRNEL